MVKHPTLDFGSGHNLMLVRSSPVSGSALDGEPAYDSVSPSAPSPLARSLSLSKKQTGKKTKTGRNRNWE